jgi:hypothetical protein
MPFPKKSFIALADLAAEWGARPHDLLHYASDGELKVCIFASGRAVETGWFEDEPGGDWNVIRTGTERISGFVPLLSSDVILLLARGSVQVDSFAPSEPNCFRKLIGAPIPVTVQELFVTAEERERFERAHDIEPTSPEPEEFMHQPGYAQVTWRGRRFEFGAKQASVIAQLHAAYLRGEPWLPEQQLLADAGSDSKRLVDLFKTQDGWRELISRRNGQARLALPDRQPAGVGTKRAFRRAMLRIVS